MSSLKTTPLNAVHRERGAKMVDFSGWEMPLHYGSQVEEHHQVRRAAGMFDVSHMLAIDASGPGARAFLRRLLANDLARLAAPGKALYSCMLNEKGGVLDDLIIYWFGAERFRMVVNAGTAERDLAWIERWRLSLAPAVELRPRHDLALIAIQGPLARPALWQARPEVRRAVEPLAPFHAAEVEGMVVARTGYTGEDGYEVMLPAADAIGLWRGLQAKQVAAAGLGARDTLRLEAGMNLYGQDMDETTTPAESGLGWTVDLSAGHEFIGRDALASAPTRHLLGLVLLDRGVMRAHQTVRTACGEGAITSGGYAPTLNRSIALARLPSAVAADTTVEVAVRGQWLRARTVKPPFVRQGKVLVNVEC